MPNGTVNRFDFKLKDVHVGDNHGLRCALDDEGAREIRHVIVVIHRKGRHFHQNAEWHRDVDRILDFTSESSRSPGQVDGHLTLIILDVKVENGQVDALEMQILCQQTCQCERTA